MASELLKTKALAARIKEPKVRDFDFGLNLTSVESLIPDLPEPKPQELLDIQEDNRKGRLLESLNKIGGRLEDSSLDFINREEFNVGSKAASEYFRNRPIYKPTPVFEGNPGKLVGVKFKDKAQEKAYKDLLKQRYSVPKGSKQKVSNETFMKKFGISFDTMERVNRQLAKELNLKHPLQTYEGREKIMRARDKLRKENIKKTSSGGVESKIKRDIKKVDATALANDVDVAHRASLKANANLGAKYLVSSLGIDSKTVNQSLVKPTEQKLGKLYDDQQKLIKGLKPGKVPKDVQKKIEKLNIKISELSDRTKGALQGVLVDEKTLKPSIYGIDYKKVLGAGLIDKPVSELTQADRDIIKLNIGEQIKTAKKFKPGMQPDGRLVDLPGGNKKGMNLAFAEALKTTAEKGKIYGPKYAKQIVNMARPAAKLSGLELLLGSAFAPLDIGEGRPMKDVALNVATLGMGVPVKDAKRVSAFADKYGLKEDLFTAKMKLAGANKIRGDQEIELTNNEEKALQAETYFKENILQPELDELRTIRQEESDPMFGLTDLGMAEGGRINYSNGSDGTDLAIKESLEAFERYLKAGGKLGYKDFIALGNEGVSKFFNKGGRVNFASGSGPMPVRLIYIIMDRLRNLKNSTFSNYNQVRMYGEQKGITELLEPYKNIPNKNRVTSAIDDAEELKKFMPDEYKPILDEIIDDTKQFKFKTAHDKQQALEKVLPEELKFENLPEEMFPMPNPENPNFIMPYGYPDKNPFQKSRITTRTEADKFTGKGTRKTYDTFNEETKQYQEPSKNTLISEEPIDEELESIIRDLDKGDLQ